MVLGSAPMRAGGAPSGGDLGLSGFAGYAIATGLPVELVPELGFSYDRLSRGRVSERGGLVPQAFSTAALDGARILAGGRLASVAVDGAAGLRLDARAYWAHELADTAAVVRSSLFGVPFSTRTSALGRDGAVLGVSVSARWPPGCRCRRATPARSAPAPPPKSSRPVCRPLGEPSARPRSPLGGRGPHAWCEVRRLQRSGGRTPACRRGRVPSAPSH